MQIKKIALPLLILCLLPVSFFSKASCDKTPGAGSTHWDNINLGSITVQRDVPVGTMIYSQRLNSTQEGAAIITCTSPSYTLTASLLRDPSGVLEHVYQTGIPGVGIKVYLTADPSTPFENPPYTDTISVSGSSVNIAGSGAMVELYKTGPITSGTVTTGKLFSRTYSGYEGFFGTLVGGQVQQLACTLNQTSVNINLGDWMTTDFTAPGSSTVSKPVSIGLNCDSGTRVNVNIQGDADTAQPGTLKLTPEENAATGVGVQMLDQNGAPVTLNSKYLLATTSTTGTYTINWQAHYIQTGSTVNSGPANANATVSISYE
ncbi:MULTISPECIES: fimbrial protein [Enterobacterales]|uniref:fimbrial protein n=1 Tax=Enterobacterales TaxID=91347 RepID=UPI002ED8FC17